MGKSNIFGCPSLWLFLAAMVFGLVFAVNALAGSIDDTDSDLVPDVFDNCSIHANGPNDGSNQVDTDGDEFGNRCDCDFSQDGFVLGDDIVELFNAYNTTSALHDMTGDGVVLGDDIILCFGFIATGPGPGSTAI